MNFSFDESISKKANEEMAMRMDERRLQIRAGIVGVAQSTVPLPEDSLASLSFPGVPSVNADSVLQYLLRLSGEADVPRPTHVDGTNTVSKMAPSGIENDLSDSIKVTDRINSFSESNSDTNIPAKTDSTIIAGDSKKNPVHPRVVEALRRLPHSALPIGIDSETLLAERERLLEARRNIIIQNLESLGNSKSLSQEITLRALRLQNVQRSLRSQVLQIATDLRDSETFVERSGTRRSKKQSLREARLTERLEQQQKRERNRKDRQQYSDYLQSVVSQQKEMVGIWRSNLQKRQRLVRQILQHHGNFEREEAKRIDRLAKDRLKALKADDEDAYLRLLDQQKDTRLTYLLKQTDEFLGGLAAKVVAQQAETAIHLGQSPVFDIVHPLVKISEDSNPQNDNCRVPIEKSDSERLPDETNEVYSTNDETNEVDSTKNQQDGADVIDYFGVAHRIKESVTVQSSNLVGGLLKEYQIRGLQWMVSLYNNHLNGILADEMGLGKTIQAISLIAYLVEKKAQPGPFLVIVPLSTMTNWSCEFERWAPSLVRIEYKGAPLARKQLAASVKAGNFNVLLTTYEYIIKDRSVLSKPRWLYLIVDEGHRMKNTSSKLVRTLSQYYTMRLRLILTGTPLQNNLPELWALLNFLLPRIFNSCKTFEEWFNAPFANTGEQVELNEEEMLLIIRRLHKVLRPFLLRRMKQDVESELPDKVERVVRCPMSALQQRLYNAVAKKTAGTADAHTLGIRRLNNTIMQLRKICNHPFVFEEVEAAINPGKRSDAQLFRTAGKFELLDRMLAKLCASGHRTLIFFQMTHIMTIMEDLLSLRRIKYLRLDGTTKAENRNEYLKLFNAPRSEYMVFLLSTRAGGLGLNLQTADTVVIFDSDWNPHQDLQAQDRAHRIGQTKEVRIYRLVTEASVEEYILERAQHKLALDGKVIQAGKFDQKSTNEERDAVLRAIMEREERQVRKRRSRVKGARVAFEEAASMNGEKEDSDLEDNEEEDNADSIMPDDELNAILARNEGEMELFGRMDSERDALDAHLMHGMTGRLMNEDELPDSYLLDQIVETADDDLKNSDLRRARSSTVTGAYNEQESDEAWLARNDLIVSSSPNSVRKRNHQLATVTGNEPDLIGDDSEAEFISTENSQSEDSETFDELQVKRPRGRPRKNLQAIDDQKQPLRLKIRVGSAGESLNVDEIDLVTRIRFIFTELENCTDKDGRYRSDLFLTLPDADDYPDYYRLIEEPISLHEIEARIEATEKTNTEMQPYASLQDFENDVRLMISNAMQYNADGSQVYADAQYMLDLLDDHLSL